jgi:hypothetical protein
MEEMRRAHNDTLSRIEFQYNQQVDNIGNRYNQMMQQRAIDQKNYERQIGAQIINNVIWGVLHR